MVPMAGNYFDESEPAHRHRSISGRLAIPVYLFGPIGGRESRSRKRRGNDRKKKIRRRFGFIRWRRKFCSINSWLADFSDWVAPASRGYGSQFLASPTRDDRK